MGALNLLFINAAVIGLLHTLAGTDHTLPLAVMAKDRRWPPGKTAWITLVCGLGNVAGSFVIGVIGIGLGVALRALNLSDSVRRESAAGIVIAFGLGFTVWGLWRTRRRGPAGHAGHAHSHGGELHAHDHIHDPKTGETILLTPRILFFILAFAPCQWLIPLFVYPAATRDWSGACAIAAIFSVATLLAMLGAVGASSLGAKRIPLGAWGRQSQSIAGIILMLTGGAISVYLR